jgi:hypothetical protein
VVAEPAVGRPPRKGGHHLFALLRLIIAPSSYVSFSEKSLTHADLHRMESGSAGQAPRCDPSAATSVNLDVCGTLRVASRRGQKAGDGWTLRLFAQNCVSPSCLIGWIQVTAGTGEITDPVAERPIRWQHLNAVEADMRR